MTSLMQTSLSGGELPPTLHGMVDLTWYRNSLKTCRNVRVKPYGGVVNRTGSRMLSQVKTSASKARLIPFSFSTDQTYVVEFGAGYLRLFASGVQQTYAWPGPDAWLTATTYLLGDYVQDGGVYYYCLIPHTAGTFATDLSNGYWYALTMSTPGVGILELPTPYSALDLAKLKFTQSADVLTLVHPDHPPYELRRYSDTKWTFTQMELNTGPFQNVNTNASISVWPSASVGDVTLTSSRELFDSSHEGMLFYLEQKDFGRAWEPGKVVAVDDVRRANGNYYKALTAGTTGQNIPVGTADNWNDGGVNWGYLHNGFGVARITAVTSTTTADATVLSRLPDGTVTSGYGSQVLVNEVVGVMFNVDAVGNILTTSLAHGLTVGSSGSALVVLQPSWPPVLPTVTLDYTVPDADHIVFNQPRRSGSTAYFVVSYGVQVGAATASYKWAFGAFGDPALGAPGYPWAVTYYQQRLCFGGTYLAPDTIWMSRTNAYNDFSQSSPVLDDDSVVFTVAGNQVNAVRSMLQIDKLIVLTSGAVWATGTGQQTDVLTPGNISVRLQAYRGASDLPPLGVGSATLYVQDKGQVVRDLSYQFATDNYTGQDLTARGSHLIDGHYLTEWAYQQSPASCVWMIRDDGTLLGLTYLREQEVAAWHHHDTQGIYESICCVSEGQEDMVYVIVKRTLNGVTTRFIERFETRVVTDDRDGFFVDCGATFDGRYASTSADLTISGGVTWDEDDTLTLTSEAYLPGFEPFKFPATTDVGDQVVFTSPTDGMPIRCTILSTSSATVATCRPNRTVPVADRNVALGQWDWARDTVTGLDWLVGETVDVLGDGCEYPQQVVAVDGSITLSPPAAVVQVGLPFVSDIETLPLAPATQETVRDRQKLVNVLRLMVNENRGFWAGPDADHLFEFPGRDVSDNYETPAAVTDLVELRLNATWERNGTTLIRHTGPTAFGLVALLPEVSIGGA